MRINGSVVSILFVDEKPPVIRNMPVNDIHQAAGLFARSDLKLSK